MEVSRYISTVIRLRVWIIALWSAIIIGSAVVYLTSFRIDNSVGIWFLDDDPELQTYQDYNSKFGEREWTYVWLRGESVFSEEFLRDLRLLQDRIFSLEQVSQVRSLADLLPQVEPGSRISQSASPGAKPTPRDATLLRQAVEINPLLSGQIVPEGDDRFTILAVQNANKIHAQEPYRIRLIDGIRQAVSSYPSIQDFGIVGTTVINSELNRAAMRDMLLYYALIGLFVVIGGWLVLRKVRDLVVLGVVVMGTILPVLGGVGALGLSFNLMTVMLPTLLVTVSVSYLIHFIGEFHFVRRSQEEQGAAPDITAAVSATFRQLLRPGLWTTLTTAIGFASLTVSPVAPIRHIGFFAAAGIGIAWLNTITVAPALLSFLWGRRDLEPPRDPRPDRPRLYLEWLAEPRPLLAILLTACFCFGASGLPRLKTDTDYVNFFRPGNQVRKDYAQLQSLALPSSYLSLIVDLPTGTRLADLDRHLAMRQLERTLLSLPGVLGIQSIDSELAAALEHRPTHGDENGSAPEYQTSARLTEALGSVSTEEYFIEEDHLLRLRVMTGSLSTNDINRFRDHLQAMTSAQPGGWAIALTGTNVLWANMDAKVVRTQLLSIGITAGVLLVLLPFVFHSLVLGLLGFAASFVPVLCTLGVMAWLDIPVNIATCIIGGVVVGIAVDDTIYYLSRVREGLSLGLDVDAAAGRATRTTGPAMIKTSLILTSGFLTMTISDFMPSAYFGMFFAFSIMVALLADLIALPAMLRLAAPLLQKSNL